MRALISKFWKWYEKNKTFNLGLATFLFTLQLVHLTWLTGDVVISRLTGYKIFGLHEGQPNHSNLGEFVIILVDYLEIPAIITTSLVYINELRKKINYKSMWFLIFLNSQWLHMFWITDEFVVQMFTGQSSQITLPFWFAWIAILIDYLEIPVILDTIRKFFNALRQEGLLPALEELKEN